jgi:prepilin-type processing-associated H-X9-DG protein
MAETGQWYEQEHTGSTRMQFIERFEMPSAWIPVVVDAYPAHRGKANTLYLDGRVGCH